MVFISSVSASAFELVNTVPTDLDIICPLVNSSDFESLLGVDINGIIETIVEQQYSLREDVETRLSTGQFFADGIESGLSTLEIYADESEKYVWILPGLLLAISALTAISIIGVVLAWKEKSGVRFQRVMSYVVLPLLILAAIVCWIMVMMLSLSTMVGTDICLSSSSNGSPDQTIQEILSTIGNGTNGTTYQVVSTYINQCNGPDPTQDIQDLQAEIQEYIDNIWRQISKIDSVGRADVIAKCGDAEEFMEMLTGARDLAKSLTTIRRSLSSVVESIGCSSINPIYTQAAHDIICTDTLSASVNGFVTFLIMWICVMAMISLRASWLRNIEEEKVYHDETDVAENMVLDEHEEYLAYISRYKHEWQEYEGFEEEGAVKSSPRSDFHEEGSGYPDNSNRGGDSDYYYGDEEYSSDVSESDLSTMGSRSMYIEDGQQEPVSYQHHTSGGAGRADNDEGVSYASGEISFATFSSENNNNEGRHSHILSLPPSNVPPPMNPEFYDVDDETLPSTTSAANNNYPDEPDSDSGTSRQRVSSKNNISNQKQSSRGGLKQRSKIKSAAAAATDGSQHSDFEPNFDQNFSHSLHPTGEVEVQLEGL